jgi:hypothetical protein
MKTPMQEMFDQLKASRKDEYGLAFSIDMLLENEQAMLEKEKEYFMFYGYQCCQMTKQKSAWSLEELYNETFNTEEK